MSSGVKVRFRHGGTSHTRPAWPARWRGIKQQQQRQKQTERPPTPQPRVDWKEQLQQIRDRLDGSRS